MRNFVFFFLLVFGAEAQKVEPIGSSINSQYNELHPLITMDGKTMYFVRAAHPSNTKGQSHSNDVWYSEKSADGRWGMAKKMPRQINRDRYNDIFDISADGNTAIIRNDFLRGMINPDKVGISVIKKKGSIWQQPEALEIPSLSKMIKGKYLSACMSTNGKVLILSFSDKKGSAEDDIYVSLMDRKGNWSEPVSIGKDINTSNSEKSPFLSADNSTLYFASDRKGGQGGFDIYMSKRKGKGWHSWTEPVNLGPDINTEKNEMYYSIEVSGEYAYLCSESNSLGFYDIFRVKLNYKEEPRQVADAGLQTTVVADPTKAPDPSTLPKKVVMLTGKVVDQVTGKPIEAKIVYEDLDDGEELGQTTSNPLTGEYKLLVPYGKRYGIRPDLDNGLGVSKNIDLSTPGEFKEIKIEDLEVAPIKTGTAVTLYNVFFEFAKATLEKESFLELDRMIGVMNKNPNMAIEVQGHTDNVGSDAVNMRLSQQRADAVKDYFLSKKISPDRVKSTGFGKDKPVASNETTEGQAKNRRVEFLILRK